MQNPAPGPQGQPGVANVVLDTLVPTNPLAALSCWVGIFSLLTCVLGIVLGPIAVATGVVSLRKGTLIQQSAYGRGTSLARSYIGIVCGALGTLAGIAALVLMITKKH
jgi:hypothetical protein